MRKLSHYLALTCLLVGCAHKETTGSKEKEITTRLSTPSIWREVAQAQKSEALPSFGDRSEIQFKSSECHCKIKSIKTGVEKIESDCELELYYVRENKSHDGGIDGLTFVTTLGNYSFMNGKPDHTESYTRSFADEYGSVFATSVSEIKDRKRKLELTKGRTVFSSSTSYDNELSKGTHTSSKEMFVGKIKILSSKTTHNIELSSDGTLLYNLKMIQKGADLLTQKQKDIVIKAGAGLFIDESHYDSSDPFLSGSFEFNMACSRH